MNATTASWVVREDTFCPRQHIHMKNRRYYMRRYSRTELLSEPDELDRPDVRSRVELVKLGRYRHHYLWRRPSVLLALLVGIAITMMLIGYQPLGSVSTPSSGSKTLAVQPAFCGIPQQVFQHFGLLDHSGEGVGYTRVPDGAQLARLPRPDSSSPLFQPITYDPTKNQLCSQTYVELYVRYIKPQPSVSGSLSSTAR